MSAMPIYEYVCEQDGSVVELLRPMSDADKAVPDPEGKGRTFKRRHSTFATGGPGPGGKSVPLSQGCCPCGKNRGSCASGN